MKIYSDRIHTRAVQEAHRDIERIAPSCNVYVDAERRGRRTRYSLDITMTGFGARHTRYRNTGQRGADDDMAATWMDWGWLIAVLFRFDPDARIGQYDGAEDFNLQVRAQIRHRLRVDPSVKNFARDHAAWWLNPHSTPNLPDDFAISSPFTSLVDRLIPVRNLLDPSKPEQVVSWLESA